MKAATLATAAAVDSGRRWLRRLAWLVYRLAPLPKKLKLRLRERAVSRVGDWLRNPERIDLLPAGEESVLVVMLGHLREDLFYAGYTEFFRDYTPVFAGFDRVIVTVQVAPFEPELALRYSPRLEVMQVLDLPSRLRQQPKLVIAFNSHIARMAQAMLPSMPDRIVYYCQEFEAGFFPLGWDYVVAERAVARSRNLVISTRLLKDFLVRRGLIHGQNVFVTRPRIEPFPVRPDRTRRLFFYYRPEPFNQRNLAEMIEQCVQEFCARHTGYEIFLVGTVATERSYEVQGTPVRVMRKLAAREYVDLISSCDVVVSLIYSAHPGVVAYQAAASGVPTVTNTYENRDARLLRSISSNLVPFDPVREELVDAVEAALAMPKGKPDFHEAFYSGEPERSLLEFHERILQVAGA